MSKLIPIDYNSPNAKRDFVASLRDTGFGVLKNHPLSQDDVQGMYDAWSGFFSSDSKMEYEWDRETFAGLFPIEKSETAKGQDVKDLKEFFHFYVGEKCPPNLLERTSAYHSKATNLAIELVGWIEEESPKDVRALYSEPLDKMMIGATRNLLRILHYPPQPRAVEVAGVRAAAHEDIDFLTILPSANEPGLQVLGKDGSWLEVPSDFGNLIVNIGDMLQEASGGYFPSTTHRVVNPEGNDRSKSRFSIPLFCHPRPEVILSERHTAQSYLDERLHELGHKS
ncbi:MAG: 2OG-Fe(II) oxygenase family protein [Alphaproteobacteria bacterium]